MAETGAALDNPPPYDSAAGDQQKYYSDSKDGAKGAKALQPPHPATQSPPFLTAGPSYVLQPHALPSPTVYHYTNPKTGEHIASLLPPDHPEMICLQAGEHVPETKFGLLGILAAVFWFPLGIGLCLLDRRVRCSRCGHIIDDGLCG